MGNSRSQLMIIALSITFLAFVGFTPLDAYADTTELTWASNSSHEHTINVGDTIIWDWSGANHNLIWDSSKPSLPVGVDDFGFPTITSSPNTYEYTFTVPGEYYYLCVVHANQRGVVTVLAAPLLDTDGDGLSDDDEVNIYGTDPADPDTDADGLTDGAEVNTHGTDPLLSDTDGDGLLDGAEVNTHGTDPLLSDTDGGGVDDGIEVNVDGTNPLIPGDDLIPPSVDVDLDGYTTDGTGLGLDCDDTDPAILGQTPFYGDFDGDGYGDPEFENPLCFAIPPFVDNNLDCNDAVPEINPEVAEIPGNNIDENCDGIIESPPSVDVDLDGYTTDGTGLGLDCDDTDPAILGQTPFYGDGDGDGYGDPAIEELLCFASPPFVDNDLDCNDADFSINPEAIEIFDNAVDEDCDGIAQQTPVTDFDGDGYDSVASGGTDCNDNDPAINPGAAEIPGNSVDENCDGIIESPPVDETNGNGGNGIEPAPQQGQWSNWGGDLSNTKNAQTESKLSVDNIANLQEDWVYTTEGSVVSFATVSGNDVYFVSRQNPIEGTFAALHSVDRTTGEANWSNPISSYVIGGIEARVSPAIQGNILVLGTQMTPTGATVFAVDRTTGEKLWETNVDTHFSSIITSSPTIFQNKVLVGVSSLEELFAAFIPGYQCCTFIGSLASLDLHTGEILWQSYTAPLRPDGVAPNDWYSGNAVWGSSPAIDPKRNSVYIATGNNYQTPNDLEDCIADAELLPTPELVDTAKLICQEDIDVPGNLFDAIVSYDLDTGDVNWANKLWSSDTWTVACFFGVHPNCPDPFAPDYDFGQAPMLWTTHDDNGQPIELVGAGQKSGIFWALDPDNGEIVWTANPGPGSTLGGMQWGTATDGDRVYGQISGTAEAGPYTIFDVNGNPTEITGGSWWAVDAATGEILWQTAAPDSSVTWGQVSVANGLLFAGTLGGVQDGIMVAMNAATGEILWTKNIEGSVSGAPTIVNGQLIWGTGYGGFGGSYHNEVFSLSLGPGDIGNGPPTDPGNNGNGPPTDPGNNGNGPPAGKGRP